MEEAQVSPVMETHLLFQLLYFLWEHRLSQGVSCEDLDDCWQTDNSWYGLMTELFNLRETYITGNDKLLLFEWLLLRLKHRLSRGVVCCLPWLFPVPLLWRLPIHLKLGMMNAIWVCGGVVWLLFCLSMAIKRWEPTFWCVNYSNVWASVPGIKLITSFLSQYYPN